MKAHVMATPALIHKEYLEGTTAVVIDVLRMTSTASVALENGCAGLLAVSEVEAARDLAKVHHALLGGERNAMRIDGFDFSNSPLEYTAERIAGRLIVVSTSNGTKAIQAASGARRLLLGALINAQAVAHAVCHEDRLLLVCAGTLGAFTLEDALAAGALLTLLRDRGVEVDPDDMAIASMRLYDDTKDDLHAALSRTLHYNRLKHLGLQEDLDFCLSMNTVHTVPERGIDGFFHGLGAKINGKC